MSNPLNSVEVPSVFEIARDQGDKNARAMFRWMSSAVEAVSSLYAASAEQVGHTVYVDAAADASVANGSKGQPFKTVTAAIAYVEANAPVDEGYEIHVAAGDYGAENVTLSRPQVHLRGSHVNNDQSMFCKIGRITVACDEDMGGVYNSQFALSGFLVSSSGNCIVVDGSVACQVLMSDLYAYSGSGKALHVPQASARVRAARCTFSATTSASDCIDFAGNYLDIRNSNIYAGSAKAVAASAGTVALDTCLVEGVTGGVAVSASGSSAFNASNCLIRPSAANSSGFVLSNTAQLTIIQNVFAVPAGTGFCVNGVLGNVVVHALNVFLPTYNNKYASVIGAGLIPASTTPTLA
jgi:hypothetical protein